MPPKKKQSPRQRSKFVNIEPRMAAWMMGIRLPSSPFSSSALCFAISTMKRVISTIEPKVVSIRIPATFGILRANSCPAKPRRLAEGTMAM